jgi:hypothetical protein
MKEFNLQMTIKMGFSGKLWLLPSRRATLGARTLEY